MISDKKTHFDNSDNDFCGKIKKLASLGIERTKIGVVVLESALPIHWTSDPKLVIF